MLDTFEEHLNAEIVFATIQCEETALEWAQATFLFERMKANPRRYGLSLTMAPETQVINSLRAHIKR